MNEIRKIDEHWKDNLLGCTFNKRLEKAILQRHCLEIGVERAENRVKRLREELSRMDGQPIRNYASSLLAALESVSEGAVVAALAPKTNKILDIGFNRADDLILDNFGLFLAALIRSPTIAITYVSLTDTGNTARALAIYYNTITTTFNIQSACAIGTVLQLGQGTSPAARDNHVIESALGSAPENAIFGTSNGGYAIGTGSLSFSGAISAGGSGTVNEMGFHGRFGLSGVAYSFMFFHDILASGVAFVAGNTLNASYAIIL